MTRTHRIVPLIIGLILFRAPALRADTTAAEPPEKAEIQYTKPPRTSGLICASFSVGSLLGLDEFLRGGEAGIQLGMAPALLLQPGTAAGVKSAGLLYFGAGADIAGDLSLEYWRFDYCAFIALGPVLRFEAGGEIPLEGGSIPLGRDAGRCVLTPLPFPSRFAAAVRLAELVRFGPFCLNLRGKLGWAAYSAAAPGAEAEQLSVELSGLAGFAAGLEAACSVELLWLP